MNIGSDSKVASHHLKRKALIYVRQSSMKQVVENTESTARQYGLVDKALELGWSQALIGVIDDDLGKSASSAEHRNGFQKLVADVAMGQVGIVMGLEMSRLARNNADFQQLLLNREGIKFPVRPVKGPDKGGLAWRPLSSGLALRILHNPRYAGAYAYGRTKLRKSPAGGASYSKRERDQWHALVKDAHSAYITWDEFEAIEERLAANARRDFRGPAREGCALLQGIVICGRCGKHFASSYKQKSKGERTPIYLCNREQLDYGKAICTSIPGAGIDTIIAKVLLEKVTPVAVDAAISVQREIVKRTEQADRLLQLHVERAQYEADLARKRVMSVDPGNRLVAQTFEQEWNEKLTLLAQAKHDYESRRKTHQNVLEPARQAKIKQFVADFATVWSHQTTTFQDKKRMIRLLIEDVTLKRQGHEVDVYIRFKTGAIIKELFRIPSSGNKPTEIDPQIIEKIDQLSSEHTAGEIAKKLNEEGVIHPTLGTFDTNAIVYLLRRFNIQTRYKRLRANGYLSQEELAEHCGVGTQTIQRWKRCGWINAKRYNDQPEYLYEPTLNALPANIAHQYSSILSTH